MLVQRRRRWADVVQMLYKCFVFAEMAIPVTTVVILVNLEFDCQYGRNVTRVTQVRADQPE